MPEVMVAFLAASCSFCFADLILRTPEAGPFLDDDADELLSGAAVPPKAAIRAASLGAAERMMCSKPAARQQRSRRACTRDVQLVGRDLSFSRAAFSLAASGLSNAFCRARARCSARLRSTSFSRCQTSSKEQQRVRVSKRVLTVSHQMPAPQASCSSSRWQQCTAGFLC